jgi:hypothetical protein
VHGPVAEGQAIQLAFLGDAVTVGIGEALGCHPPAFSGSQLGQLGDQERAAEQKLQAHNTVFGE